MKRFRWLATVVTLVFALGLLAMPAVAAKDKSPDSEFEDMDEQPWALAAVVTMNVQGIIKGDGAGHFRPAASVSHQEAIALAIRLMGMEDQAKALDLNALDLNIADLGSVADWAKADVALAAKLNLLPALDNGSLDPAGPATRLWTAIFLAKALGFDAEAQANMNATLSFADAASIPANAVGYVDAASKHGLFKGIPGDDGKVYFMPDGAVTRAQIAVLLGRSDDQLPFTPERAAKRKNEIKGRVSAVDTANSTVTVEHHGLSTTYTLAANASVFVDEKLSTLAGVEATMKVKLQLDAQSQVLLLTAKAAEDKEKDEGEKDREDDRTSVEGRFVSTTAGQITLQVRKAARTFTLADKYIVQIKGQTAAVADIPVGANVHAWLDASGKIVFLVANDPNRDDDKDREGDRNQREGVGSISAISQSGIEITDRKGAKANYTLSPNLKIESEAQVLTAADLKAGDMVEYKLDGSVVVELKLLAHKE